MNHARRSAGAIDLGLLATLEPIPVLKPLLPPVAAYLPHLERIDRGRWYSNHGPLWREFRDEFAAWLAHRAGCGAVSVLPTSSGTTAIEVALRARAVPGRRLCLMPSYTFIASAHAVHNVGLHPYLLDVDPNTLVLTPEIASVALTALPERPAAVLVVSAFGAPPDVKGWEEFEDRTGIPVVFDAAAAATSLRSIGRQPLCVSLHATKVLGIGEGGAIISTDGGLVDRLTTMASFGFAGSARTSSVRGGNYRISEYTAAVGLAALTDIEAKEARLLRLGALYAEALSGRSSRLQAGAGTGWATMTLNIIVTPDQASVTTATLDRNRIEWRRWWGLGTHTHPAFADVPREPLPATELLAPCVIGVPFFEGLTTEQILRVADCFA